MCIPFREGKSTGCTGTLRPPIGVNIYSNRPSKGLILLPMHRTLILLLILLGLNANAQKAQGVSIEPKRFDYGAIEYWDNPAATFIIYNEGKVPFTVLPTLFDKEIYAVLPKEKIPPGQNAFIGLYYYTPEVGTFDKEVKLYISSSDHPIKLKVTGEILSLAQNALTACPTFGGPGEAIVTSPQTNVVVTRDKEETESETERSTTYTESNRRIETTYQSTKTKEEILGAEPRKGNVPYGKTKAEILGSDKPVAQNNSGKSKAEILGSDEPLAQNSSGKTKAEILGADERPAPKEVVVSDDMRTIKVVDGQTRVPLPNSEVKIYQDDQLLVTLNTGETGKTNQELAIGKYNFEVFKEGYELLNTRMFIYEKSKNLVINLNLFEEEVIEEMVEQVAEVTPVIAPKPPEITKEPVTEAPKEADLIGGQLSKSKFQANNIIFLVDISRSMEAGDKMDLLKESMKNLTSVLRDIDMVTLIAYAYRYEVVLETTEAKDVGEINRLIDGLETKGKTYGVKGLEKAYEIVQEYYNPQGNNQIILATDGMFNSPNFSERDLVKMVREYAEEEIKLSVVGFGQDEKATKLMKRIANEGTGNFIQIAKDIDNTQLLVNEIKTQSTIY